MIRNRFACGIWIVSLLSVPGAVWAQPATPDKTPGAGMLPPTIPILPLPDAMLFPNVSRPLHIFEPRYRAMVADALKGDRIIGMVTLRPGYEADYEGRPPIYPIGCAGVIADVGELPDEDLVNALAQYLDLDPVDRQELLERNGALSRSQALIDLLEAKVTPPR